VNPSGETPELAHLVVYWMVLLTSASVAAAWSLADEAGRSSARGVKNRIMILVVEPAACSNFSADRQAPNPIGRKCTTARWTLHGMRLSNHRNSQLETHELLQLITTSTRSTLSSANQGKTG